MPAPEDLFPTIAGIAALAFSIFPYPATKIAGALRETISAESMGARSQPRRTVSWTAR